MPHHSNTCTVCLRTNVKILVNINKCSDCHLKHINSLLTKNHKKKDIAIEKKPCSICSKEIPKDTLCCYSCKKKLKGNKQCFSCLGYFRYTRNKFCYTCYYKNNNSNITFAKVQCNTCHGFFKYIFEGNCSKCYNKCNEKSKICEFCNKNMLYKNKRCLTCFRNMEGDKQCNTCNEYFKYLVKGKCRKCYTKNKMCEACNIRKSYNRRYCKGCLKYLKGDRQCNTCNGYFKYLVKDKCYNCYDRDRMRNIRDLNTKTL